jgi:hypothetical protein
VVGKAVAALRGTDNGAARADHLERGGHPLDRLVEVLVQREAGVGRDDDVERFVDRAHGDFASGRRGSGVHRQEVAAERGNDLLAPVQQDVDGEVETGAGGDGPDVVVHRVAVRDTPGRLRVADTDRVVQDEHGLKGSQAGRHELRPAGEAGEEVRFDKAGGEPDIGFDPLPVQPDRDVVAEPPEPAQHRRVARVVVDDAHGVHDSVAEHRPLLRLVLPRCVPVATRMTMSSRSTIPSSSSRIAGIIRCRGWGRV